MNLLDHWKLAELRIAIIGDLADFIPQNYYESLLNNDLVQQSKMDYELYKLILNDQNKNPHNYSSRQVAAGNVFKFIALYIATSVLLHQRPKLLPQEAGPPEQQTEYEVIKTNLNRLYNFLFSCCDDLFLDLDNWLLYLPENEAKPFRSDNLKWSKDIFKKKHQAFIEKFGFIPECKQELFKENLLDNLATNISESKQLDKQEINKPKTNNIPGTIPRTAIGRLAVTEAWEIEQETGRRAIAKEVLEKLQAWAESGKKYDEVLYPKPAGTRGMVVYWITSKFIKKSYSLTACEKALQIWNKSRQ